MALFDLTAPVFSRNLGGAHLPRPLADDGLEVVAGDVVPGEAVVVEAVQHGQARLVPTLQHALSEVEIKYSKSL